MGREFIVVVLIFTLVVIEMTFDRRGTMAARKASDGNRYVEIVKRGEARVYPLAHSPLPLQNGERLEYLDDGTLLTTRMSGGKLILFGLAIDINRAGIEDLAAVPGIGLKTAQSIVDFRKDFGKFRAVRELIKVRGIGEKRLKKIKAYLKV